MSAVLLLAVGLVIVIGGVLVLRLHAFVALILAALAVACLTPSSAFVRQSLATQAKQLDVRIEEEVSPRGEIRLSIPIARKVSPGDAWEVVRLDRHPWNYQRLGRLTILAGPEQTENNSPRRTITASYVPDKGVPEADLLLKDSDLVVSAGAEQAAITAASKTSGPDQVASGFGATAAGIGMLIAFASIVGKCLLDSGAADRVVRSALRITGEAGAPAAFVGSGFLLGIPVFFDTVFYLMLPLGKALCRRTGKDFLFYVLTIVAGATMAHSLVPPTPGPLLVAAELNVGVGLMMVVGTVVGGGSVIAGYFFAAALNRRYTLPLRELTEAAPSPAPGRETPDSELPPLWLSLLPLLLPVVLIGGAEVFATWRKEATLTVPATVSAVVAFLGDKNVALILSAAIAAGTLVWKKGVSRQELAKVLQESLSGAGTIILITSAGGAFGKVMQQTGVASLISELPVHSTPAVLTMAFLITAAIRTAQGSATVAMITAVGVLAPLASTGELAFHPVWLAMAIGCGSKPLAWMNDSGFWVITQMSGMSEAEGLKYITTLLLVMSVVGLAITIAGAMLVPLM